MVFGYAAIGYLFLGGLGSGAFFFAATAYLWDGLRPTRTSAICADLLKPGFYVAPAALLGGILLLSFEVGNFDRVWLLMLSPFGSIMATGAWMLVLTAVLSLLFLLYQNASHRTRIWANALFYVVGDVLSLGTMAYTGLLLSTTLAFDFWTTGWLPVLFVASSLSSGFAACAGCSALFGAMPHGIRFGTSAMGLWTLGSITGAAETLALGVFLLDRYLFGGTATQSVMDVLAGDLAGIFWVLVVGGLAVPVVIRFVAHDMDGYRSALILTASLATLVGCWALRYVVVSAGIWTPLMI